MIDFEPKKSMEILNECLQLTSALNMIIKPELRAIPELDSISLPTCSNIMDALIEYFNKEGSRFDVSLFLSWCMYAGIGACALWSDSRKTLEEYDLYDLLMEGCTIFDMDEHVMEFIGTSLNENSGQMLQLNVKIVSDFVTESTYNPVAVSREPALLQIRECACGMFSFGICYELLRREDKVLAFLKSTAKENNDDTFEEKFTESANSVGKEIDHLVNVRPEFDENNFAKQSVPKYCRICGTKLLPDSIFCENCGTKIITVNN